MRIIVQSLHKSFTYGREVGLSGKEGDIGYPRIDLHMFDLHEDDECPVRYLSSLIELVPVTTMVTEYDYVYIFSGVKSSVLSYDVITKSCDSIQKFFLGGSRLDLGLVPRLDLGVVQSQGRGWSPAEIPVSSSRDVSCTSFMGKIYFFGRSKLEPQVFDTHVGRWKSIPDLPSDLDGCAVYPSAIPDHGRRRLLVYLTGGQLPSPSLYAFHPLKNKWKLISHDFRGWTPVAAAVGKVILFHGRKYPSLLRAFDTGSRKWLTVTWKSAVEMNYLKALYHALLPLDDNVLCLANWVHVLDSEHRTKMRFFKFQVEHQPGDATVWLVPISYPCGVIRGVCEVHHLLALPL